ncbi:VOC family protein [Frondihabitans cladoniiphilus]|uniref:VOC family protein n=1 Tax=Frondihabitans cladoniiphilus TaxID=715785 RepID=A0ABP8VZ86_9MICO
MSDHGGPRLSTINIGAPVPGELARFYATLLGGEVTTDDAQWATVRLPGGATGLAFQLEQHYVPPVWPAGRGEQQMQVHLEIQVDDLERAAAWALQCGARLADYQPQDDVRVCLDPAGHPFCLWIAT